MQDIKYEPSGTCCTLVIPIEGLNATRKSCKSYVYVLLPIEFVFHDAALEPLRKVLKAKLDASVCTAKTTDRTYRQINQPRWPVFSVLVCISRITLH